TTALPFASWPVTTRRMVLGIAPLPYFCRRENSLRGRLLALALFQADAVGFELAAGGEDVAAARRADRRGIAGAVDDIAEGLDRFVGRAFEGRARPGVEGNEIDL